MTNPVTFLKKVTNQNDLSQFLKRKRLELGLKLEDLSEGVCSSSYLSRIENNVVEASETYYKALFEKMNINYETLTKERSRNLYHELLEAYLSSNYEEMDNLVNHALSSNSYAETEIELMVLFYNIITKRYLEVRDAIVKLDEISENLNNTELLFYLYACALYSYATNQNVKAYKQILVLTSIQFDDIFFEACIYDLGIKIMFNVGMNTLALKYYLHFEKISRTPVFNNSLCMNKMMLLTIDADVDYDLTLSNYFACSKYLKLENEEVKEFYLYHLGLIYYYNKDYEKLYELLINESLNAKTCMLLACSAYNIHNYDIVNKVMNKIKNYVFTKYEKMYKDFVVYIQMYFNNDSDYILINYLRNVLIVKSNYYDFFLEKTLEIEYVKKALATSKYKEGLKFINKYLTESIHEKLK